jgi:hypothetical protein
MTRNLKVLGLALAAVSALFAVSASAASAHNFHGEASPGIITGSQEAANPNVFTAGAAVQCNSATFEATALDNATSITVHPTYGNCEWNSEPANVRTNMCAYILQGATNASGDAKVEVECEGTSKIEVEIPGVCTAKIGAQQGANSPEGGVHYTNTGTGASREVTINSTVSSIEYEKVGGFGCFFAGDGAHGEYSGGVTASGYVDNGNAGTATTPAYNMGVQKGIWVE